MKDIHLDNDLKEPLSAKLLLYLMKHGIAKQISKRRLLGKEYRAVITVVKNWHDVSLRNDFLDILNELKPESVIYLSWMIHKYWFVGTSREILEKMNVSPVEVLIEEYSRHRINKTTIIEMLGSLKDPAALNFLIYNLTDPFIRQSCMAALINMEGIAVLVLIKNLSDEQRRKHILDILVYNHKYSIQPLIESLYDERSREFSAICLSKIGEPAASALIDSSTDPQIQNIILRIVTRNPKAFINSLIQSLQNEKSVQFCEKALLLIGEEAIPYLGTYLSKPYTKRIEEILLKMGEKAIPFLIYWLEDPQIRSKAQQLLNMFGLRAVPYLIDSLSMKDIAKYVEQVLIDIDKPIHIQLIESLKKKTIQTQIRRIIIARGRSILPYLHEELEKGFNESHKAIVEILGIFTDEISINPLIYALHKEPLRENCKNSLSRIGKKAIPKLISNLDDERIREDLISIIVSFKSASVPHLLDSLRIPELQTHCTQCLEKIGDPAVRGLISLFEDPDLAQVAYGIIVRIGRTSAKYLIDSLDHESKKEMCRKALLEIGEPAVPELISNLSSIHQKEIANLLLEIGECTIPYLIQYFKRDDIRPVLYELVLSFELRAVPHLIESLRNLEAAPYSEELLEKIEVPINQHLINALEDMGIQDQIKRIVVSRGPSIIPHLHLELMKEYTVSQGAMVDILGIFRDPSSVKVLIRTLENEKLRDKSKKSLSMIGKAAIPDIIQNLLREKARDDLIDILVEQYHDSISPLIASLENKNIREYSADCLYRIGEPAIEELILVLRDAKRSDIALNIIVKNGEVSVKHLIKYLTDEKLVEYCSQALLRIGEIAVPHLIASMTDSNKESIGRILTEMEGVAVPYLLNALGDDEIRQRIMPILQNLSSHALQSFIPLLGDEKKADHIENILKYTDRPIDCYLVESLQDKKLQIRIKNILLQRDEMALSFLHEKLMGDFHPWHKCIVEILGELKHVESVDYLIFSLRHPELFDLSRQTITEFGETAVAGLTKALDNDHVAQHATDILLKIGDCVLPHIRHSVLHRIKNKKYAIYILGSLMDIQSASILRKFQNSLEEDISSYASCALGILGEDVDSKSVIDAYRRGDDFMLKDFALRALHMFSDLGMVDELLALLHTERDSYRKYYLLSILSDIGDLRAVQNIVDLLEHEKDKTVKFFILKTLREFKDPRYIPIVRENLGLEHPYSAEEEWIQDNEKLSEIFEKDMIFDRRITDLKELFEIYQQVFDYSSDKLEKRDQQIQYTILCYEGLTHRIPVIIEGPTGIGKTRALITAFLPFILRKEGYRVLYCTRTINQLENFMTEFSKIRKTLYEKYECSDIKVTLNIGKENMKEKTCPDIENCEFCVFKNIKDFNYSYGDFFMDFNELRRVRDNRCCPLATARWVTSPRADVVACAFAFLSHERMRNWFLGSEEKRSKTILIIDEAHNFLEEVSEKPYVTFVSNPGNMDTETTSLCDDSSHIYFLKEIGKNFVNESIKPREYTLLDGEYTIPFGDAGLILAPYLEVLRQRIEDLANSMPNDKILSSRDNKKFVESLSAQLVSSGLPDIESLYYQVLNEIKKVRSHGDRSGMYPIYQAYHIVDSLIKLYQRPYEFVIRKKDRMKEKQTQEGKREDNQAKKFEQVDRLEIFSINPRKRVQEIVSNFYSCIFTSATLSPVDKVSLLLGFDRSIRQKMTSPFPDKNYGCFVIAGVHSGSKEFTREMGYRFDLFEKEVIFSVVDDILQHTDRNTGIFLSSKEILEEIYWAVWKLCKHRDRLILLGNDDNISGDPKDDYDILVDIYRNRIRKDLKGKDFRGVENKMAVYRGLGRLLGERKLKKGVVLVDLIGGKFAEGVNYGGSEMEIGILIGLPFKNYEENEKLYTTKSGFFYMLEGDRALADNLSYRYDAFRKLAQTAGRIHRSKEDKGVLLFIDERLLGIKKSIERGENADAQWNYNFLSSKNVEEEWKVMQKQLRNKKIAVFYDEKTLSEKRNLFSRLEIFRPTNRRNTFMVFKGFLKKHLENIEPRAPIDSKTMNKKIQKFFERGEDL